MDPLLQTIAEQGFGYLLFAGAILLLFFFYKENKALNQKMQDQANQRVDDLKETQANYVKMSEASQTTGQNVLTIVKNIQDILNNLKKV